MGIPTPLNGRAGGHMLQFSEGYRVRIWRREENVWRRRYLAEAEKRFERIKNATLSIEISRVITMPAGVALILYYCYYYDVNASVTSKQKKK